MKKVFKSVDEYIASFPTETQKLLLEVRNAIRKAAPEAEERIAYNMPGYKSNGKALVYFAGYKNHIGFYATPTGHSAFAKDLAKYKQGKGSVQFTLHEDLPLDLIKKIVEFRLEEISRK